MEFITVGKEAVVFHAWAQVLFTVFFVQDHHRNLSDPLRRHVSITANIIWSRLTHLTTAESFDPGLNTGSVLSYGRQNTDTHYEFSGVNGTYGYLQDCECQSIQTCWTPQTCHQWTAWWWAAGSQKHKMTPSLLSGYIITMFLQVVYPLWHDIYCDSISKSSCPTSSLSTVCATGFQMYVRLVFL